MTATVALASSERRLRELLRVLTSKVRKYNILPEYPSRLKHS